MKKLCQCKQDTLHALVLGTATGAAEYEDDDDLDDFAYEQLNAIVKLLESDCVCEKKETVTKSDQLKGTSHGVVRDEKGEIIAQCRCPSHEKEKQSQPPCEHEFIVRDVPDADDIKNYFFRFYCCYKCGLVTCKNPNDK